MAQKTEDAFPTHVGMNRFTDLVGSLKWSVPHACGDEPPSASYRYIVVTRSPRMWG